MLARNAIKEIHRRTTAVLIGAVFLFGWTEGWSPALAQQVFTDDPLVVRATPIKAMHLTELRTAINTLRARYGLAPSQFTDPTITARNTPVRGVHLTELRTALDQVYQAAGRALPTYTDATLVARTQVIRATHMSEIRAAVRTAEQFPLTLTVAFGGTGSGTITSTPVGIGCSTTCSHGFSAGTAVTLTATPSTGSTFTGWSGGGCSGTGTCTVTMNTAVSLTATFTLQQFTLTVTRAGSGSGTVTSTPAGINCPGTCTASFASGTPVTLTATPGGGSTFASWGGACSGAGTCTVTMDAAKTVTATFQRPSYRTYGLDFSPYIDGQDPNLGSQVSEEQLRGRAEIIAPYTQWIRTFGSSSGLEKAGLIAHDMGLKAALGAWLSRDLAANEREISNLIRVARAGEVDMAIVGSEVLLRGDLSEDQLIGYINRVKQEVPGIPVTTADVYDQILSHPAVVSAVDVVLVNYYPYWEGIKVDQALAAIHGWHQQVRAAAGGKSILVSETGWPSGGNPIGEAVPSAENASFYFLNFVSWARANNVPYFYFEAFDESWKANYEGPQGAHWGVWDKEGNLKPGMQEVFDGRTMPDNWSGTSIPGGPGNPTIEFTYVPPYGSFENLSGQIWHVRPSDYRVAVYIKVRGGWWTKPYWNTPLTVIRPDGSWTCDITTGGVDQEATAIVAYLAPNGYSPPLMSGGSTLPGEIEQNSVAKVETTRAP